jgi:aerobic carbon-monoxide dehydrogenase large subunit
MAVTSARWRSGVVTLARYAAVDEGQIHGGVAQGVGQALMESIVFDADGQLVTGSFQDYAMPRATDFPDLVSGLTEVPATTNPLGVKGAGEAGATGAPPAVIGAILDALRQLGIDHIDMPATPHRIWQAIHAANATKAAAE